MIYLIVIIMLLLKDPRGNLLEQWMEEEAELGVALKSFQLSDNPPLGDWSIKVKLQVSIV